MQIAKNLVTLTGMIANTVDWNPKDRANVELLIRQNDELIAQMEAVPVPSAAATEPVPPAEEAIE